MERFSLRTTLAIVAVAAAACTGCSRDNAATDNSEPLRRAEDVPPPIAAGDGGGGGCATPSDGSGETSSGASGGSSAEAPGGSPFAAVGARQLPGPDTTVTTIPSAPVSIQVGRPGNPDELSAAATVDGAGTPAPVYDFGEPQSAPGTTLPPPSDGPPDAPPAGDQPLDCDLGL